MAEVDKFEGRVCPSTGERVTVTLWRSFDALTLQDVWAVKFKSGSKHEYYEGLTHDQAMRKYEYAQQWWA